jgi:hypothetical protein
VLRRCASSRGHRGPRARCREAVARPGALPLGLSSAGSAFGVVAVVSCGWTASPTLCVFKPDRLPCPTCGGTRTLGRLFARLRGRVVPEPARFGRRLRGGRARHLVLLPRRRALGLEIAPRLGLALRWGAVFLLLANWVYLVAAGR